MIHPDNVEGHDYRTRRLSVSTSGVDTWSPPVISRCFDDPPYSSYPTLEVFLDNATTKDHIHILMAFYLFELPGGLSLTW